MVRRSLAMAAGEQYLRLAIGFASIAAVSRLLTPSEIGVSVIGMGIVLIVLGLREFATSDCLIRREQITGDDVRTSFTVLFLLTVVITSALALLAPWLGTFYGEEKLARFLLIGAVAGLIEAVSLPIKGLLRRDMAFGTLALINTASVTVTAVVTVLLALFGFSYMSVAWAAVAAATTTTFLSFYFRPDLSIFRPALSCWRNILAFGGYNGASHVINRAYEALPQLLLGHMLPHSAVGLYNRANVTAGIPDQIVLTSVVAVAFPAFAAEVRSGRSLTEPYLRALSLITVLYWPALVLLALLAHPVVLILLGDQWLAVIPLLQVIAIAALAWFAVALASPVLLAVGATRDRMLVELIGRSGAAVGLCSAAYLAIAHFGVMAMAASQLVNLPFQMLVALWFVRRHIAFRWREIPVALWKSAVVTATSAAGPCLLVASSDLSFDVSVPEALLAALLAALGWLAGVLMTGHPVLAELRNATDHFPGASSFVARLHRPLAPGVIHGPKPGEAD